MPKTRRAKRDFHPSNFTTCQFNSLYNLPALEQSDGVKAAAEDAQTLATVAHASAARETLPGNCSNPTELFGPPTPKTLEDAFLAACDGDQRKADLVRANADLSNEVERLRKELDVALFDLNGEEQKIFPFLKAGEKNTFVRQSTHLHAQEVLRHLPPVVRAVWVILLLRTSWGGYIAHTIQELVEESGIAQATLYDHIKTLTDRGIIVKHPKGWMINPAIAQCCSKSEQFSKRQEFAAFYQRENSKRKRTKVNEWGHTTLTDDRPVRRVLVGPKGEEVVVQYSDGGISAYVGTVSPNHAASIISECSEKKSRKFRKVGKVKSSSSPPTV